MACKKPNGHVTDDVMHVAPKGQVVSSFLNTRPIRLEPNISKTNGDICYLDMLLRGTTLGKLFTPNVPLFTKQYNLVPCDGFHANAP